MLLASLWITTAVTVGLFLSSCSGSPPTSSATEALGEPEFLSKAPQKSAVIKLRTEGVLVEDGSILVTLRARCPAGFRVVEGPITIYQGPLFQEIFGEGFFTTTCTGDWRRETVPVRAPERFQRGKAKAGASLMVEHPATGEFLQGDDNKVLTIR
jgi:hypothetical protein